MDYWGSPIPGIKGQDYVIMRTEKMVENVWCGLSRSVEHPRAPPRKDKIRGEVELGGFSIKILSENECDLTYLLQGNHFLDGGFIRKALLLIVAKSRAKLVVDVRRFVEKEMASCQRSGKEPVWRKSDCYAQSLEHLVEATAVKANREQGLINFAAVRELAVLGQSALGQVKKVKYHAAVYVLKELNTIGSDPEKLRQFFQEIALLRNLKRHKVDVWDVLQNSLCSATRPLVHHWVCPCPYGVFFQRQRACSSPRC